MTIAILDTTVFCELLNVPMMASGYGQVLAEFEMKVDAKEEMLLPIVTILETGNHIGQNGNGSQRRAAAMRFEQTVTLAIAGEAPFVVTPMLDADALKAILPQFPNWAARVDSKGKGSGLGDLLIVDLWKQQCRRFPHRRVYVWSRDEHLKGFDHDPAG